MRKIFILGFVVVANSSFAQRTSGLKIGNNISWIETTKTSNPQYNDQFSLKPSVTLSFGYSWNIAVSKKTSIVVDLIYNKKGSKETPKQDFASVKFPIIEDGIPIQVCYLGYDKPTSYFSIPLAFSYNIKPHLFVELGVEPSFSPIAMNYFDFSALVGVGYTFGNWNISGRYIHGLRDTMDALYADYFSDKNRTIQFSLTMPVFKHMKRQ